MFNKHNQGDYNPLFYKKLYNKLIKDYTDLFIKRRQIENKIKEVSKNTNVVNINLLNLKKQLKSIKNELSELIALIIFVECKLKK